MTIKILPPRLANQIAAGEVVERPASVVKELVENSLDSGATKIDIDIEKGGAKLIRIRDNGKGIPKDELGLALSRHATSKIDSLDDLEAIVSLGFRGEALASISSVSRLTLTSRPTAQQEAWSAYSEGRDMDVKLQPAAHPKGTSVEVLDLFFNTPARRKFLRTEKTEFAHIDELIKRIALSRFDVGFNLRHNGKLIKQYRAASNTNQVEKRLAAICGNQFAKHILQIELEHQGLKLHGWITSPEGARQQGDLQYCYVNGRMMRDKLINHAIRQSYEHTLRPDQFAAYVLYIELDPHQVDVNVHPAKHEVRFHQARLVHDFIYQALSDALAQGQYLTQTEVNQGAFHQSNSENVDVNSPTQGNVQDSIHSTQQEPRKQEFQQQVAFVNTPDYPNKVTNSEAKVDGHFGGVASSEVDNQGQSAEYEKDDSASVTAWQPQTKNNQKASTRREPSEAPSPQEVRLYKELLTTVENESAAGLTVREPGAEFAETVSQSNKLLIQTVAELGKAVSLVDKQYLLLSSKKAVHLLALSKAEWYRIRGQLGHGQQALKPQPLLVPLALKVEKSSYQSAMDNQDLLAKMGIECRFKSVGHLVVMSVPQPLRQQNLQSLIPELLNWLSLKGQETDFNLRYKNLADWLANQITVVKNHYTLSEGIQILAELEQLWQDAFPLTDGQLLRPVNFTATIAALTS